MNILHIVPSYKPAYVYGGTIESIARLCEAQVHAGTNVEVFTTTANGKTELNVEPNKKYNVDGVNVIYFKRTFRDPFYISPALWKKLYSDCSQYDVVHIHSWWNILVLVAALICKAKKVRTFISPRGMMSDYIRQHKNRFVKQSMHRVLGRSLLNYMTFHATSKAEFEECKKLIPAWKGFVLPNIIYLPSLHISKTQNDQFTVVFLSRIHPKKGIELLMEAISAMKVKPLLKIAGTGEDDYMNALKQKVKDLNIAANIEWLGWLNREEKFEVLMQADLFALTSYNENFANAVIESLHAGTPVLISGGVGLSNFVKEHTLGWICSLHVNDIKSKLEEAMADAAIRSRVSICGPLVIKNYLSEEKLVGEYFRYYKTL